MVAAVTTIRDLNDNAIGEINPAPIERDIAYSALTEVEDQLKAAYKTLTILTG